MNTDKLFEAMEDFENIMDQELSNKKVQSNKCLIRLSEGNMDHAEKFVQPSEIHTLNIRTKLHNLLLLYNVWWYLGFMSIMYDLFAKYWH